MFVTTIQGVYVCEYILYPFLCGQGPCLAARTEQKALPLDVHLLAKLRLVEDVKRDEI